MDTFFIIGIRHNPQLGSYLSKAIVAKAKVNKASITAKFTEYGEPASLRFSICPNMVNGRHFCIADQHCVYGSYEYYGYTDKDKAIAELKTWLDKGGSSAERADRGIELFSAA